LYGNCHDRLLIKRSTNLRPRPLPAQGKSDGGIEVEVSGEDLCSFAGEEHRRRLAVARPGPLDPAPETKATLSLSPSPMLSLPVQAIAMCAHPPCRDNQICDSLQTTARAASGPSGNSAHAIVATPYKAASQ
jgi:hypothetical protein